MLGLLLACFLTIHSLSMSIALRNLGFAVDLFIWGSFINWEILGVYSLVNQTIDLAFEVVFHRSFLVRLLILTVSSHVAQVDRSETRGLLREKSGCSKNDQTQRSTQNPRTSQKLLHSFRTHSTRQCRLFFGCLLQEVTTVHPKRSHRLASASFSRQIATAAQPATSCPNRSSSLVVPESPEVSTEIASLRPDLWGKGGPSHQSLAHFNARRSEEIEDHQRPKISATQKALQQALVNVMAAPTATSFPLRKKKLNMKWIGLQ